MSATQAHRAVEAVWRIESAKSIGALARIVRDVGIVEELAQDDLVLDLEKWPEHGMPDRGSWPRASAAPSTACAAQRCSSGSTQRATASTRGQDVGRGDRRLSH